MFGLINSNDTVKMTSVEIAELVGSQHGNVRISIERLAKRGVIQLPAMQKVENEQSFSQNKFTNAYIFEGEQGKRDSIIVVAQLCPEFTARLVDRWRELEEQVAKPAFPVPQTMGEALRLAADLWEEKERITLEKKQALDYVDRQARYIGNLEKQLRDGLTLPEFVKRLNGVNVKEINVWAAKQGWVHKHGKIFMTSALGRARGYVYDKDSTYINPAGEEMWTSKVQLTNEGARKLYREYLKLNLPMKKSWNGEFSNDPFKDGV